MLLIYAPHHPLIYSLSKGIRSIAERIEASLDAPDFCVVPLSLPLLYQQKNRWQAFVDKYKNSMGKLVIYQREGNKITLSPDDAHPWPDCKAPNGEPLYSVETWAAWFDEFAANPDQCSEICYLTDIEMPRPLWKEFVALNPWLAGFNDLKSPLSLNSYLHKKFRRITTDLGPRMYIAVTVENNNGSCLIATPPHKDGHGSETSFHLVLMGSGYNFVVFFDEDQLETEKEKAELRKKLSIPRVPTLPHNTKSFTFNTNLVAYLKDLLQDEMIEKAYIGAVRVAPGQVIGLPANVIHYFFKVCFG